MARLRISSKWKDEEILLVTGDHLTGKAESWWNVYSMVQCALRGKPLKKVSRNSSLVTKKIVGGRNYKSYVKVQGRVSMTWLSNWKNCSCYWTSRKEIAFEVEKDGLARNLEEAKAKAKRIEVIVKKYDSYGFPGGYEGNSLASFEHSELESARSTIESLTEKLECLQKPMKTSTGGEVKLVDTVHDEVKSLVSANEVQNVKRRAEAPPMVTVAERPQVQRKKVAHPEEENRIEVAPVGLSSAPVIPQVDKGKALVDAVVQDQVVREKVTGSG
ncbi:uncharacterized protein BYT42DRAFT_634961 [Radiomyces spectabilis]|uniref:uncharacterized protein n=1 Tax=Radiomyces spectabilis TaxID=64574 RepID=UPI00221F72A2|nr:uncharacterized protein BYT42DRAFT_634961 [Radiomyces spectabilis]KAI8381616.1 hypothetical protein BYT42DRAFT_634961 [Radiomyces spectabilis]